MIPETDCRCCECKGVMCHFWHLGQSHREFAFVHCLRCGHPRLLSLSPGCLVCGAVAVREGSK
jgi:hypothetical protein